MRQNCIFRATIFFRMGPQRPIVYYFLHIYFSLSGRHRAVFAAERILPSLVSARANLRYWKRNTIAGRMYKLVVQEYYRCRSLEARKRNYNSRTKLYCTKPRNGLPQTGFIVGIKGLSFGQLVYRFIQLFGNILVACGKATHAILGFVIMRTCLVVACVCCKLEDFLRYWL